MQNCPCGSGLAYTECCGRYITGAEIAPTAEALMRSRYSAYAVAAVDYLGETLHPDSRGDWDRQATQNWADESEWLQLDIRKTEAGGIDDEEGQVEFIATFNDQGVPKQHHELSLFKRLEGRWYYVDGAFPKPATQRNTNKVGRNDPCICGSGKKYKKCCGA